MPRRSLMKSKGAQSIGGSWYRWFPIVVVIARISIMLVLILRILEIQLPLFIVYILLLLLSIDETGDVD